MKTNSSIRSLKFALLLAACAGIASQAVCAQQTYHVDITTASLVSGSVASNAPFALDFQLNWGSGSFGNNASITNFTFGGGSAGAPVNLSGTAAGDLSSIVTLSDSSVNAFNDFNQVFAPGSTLSFDLTLSNNTTIGTPDSFHIAILDHTGGQIPTTQPSGSPQDGTDGLDLAEFSIGGLGQIPQHISVQTYAGANNPTLGGDYSGVNVSVQSVPEPTSWALAFVGFGFSVYLRRRTA